MRKEKTELINKVLRSVDRLYWLWLGVAAPFLLFPSAKRSLVLLIIPMTWILHWVLVHSEERRAKRNPEAVVRDLKSRFPVTPLNLGMLFLAVMVLVSLWTTYDLSISLGKIAGVVFGFGIYFAVVRLCENEKGFWISLGVFLILGFGIAVLGLLGTNWFTTKVTLLNPITSRIPALINGLQGAQSGFHPNEVAGTLIWIIPLILSLFTVMVVHFKDMVKTFRQRRMILFGFLFMITNLFMIPVLVLTQSRGAYIGFSLTILLLILIALPKNWKWRFLAGLGLVLILLAVLLSTRRGEVQKWFSGQALTNDSTFSIESLESRVIIWSNAVKGIQDFPFTGMGLNTFRSLNSLLYPNAEIPPDFDLGHAHNEFLQIGVELGIPGMVAFISIYIVAFWMLIRSWKLTYLLKKPPEQENPNEAGKKDLGVLTNGSVIRSIVLGLGGGLFAHSLYGLVDAVALGAKPGFVFWALLGLVTGLYSLVSKTIPLITQFNEMPVEDN